MSLAHLGVLVISTVVAASSLAADRRGGSDPDDAVRHPLSPAQINAVREVGRGVLLAKKNASEDDADSERLARLRASVEQLGAAELDRQDRDAITLQSRPDGQGRGERPERAKQRERARADARGRVDELRRRSAELAVGAATPSAGEPRSGGMPIGDQRAKLLDRLAQKLDEALDDANPNRAAALRELNAQLHPRQGGLSDAPVGPATPTIQAMPAGFVAPATNAAISKD